ncbi:hypothetical protein GOP47_0011752 [Adiantum capillus-veneris]|uniref:Uncharacterized protein n=1 Tax=Adiantum capillus-veneris TaxID=13818 RepID=A0A9D4UTS4_ADICA|nr:hypothetical protein GOP47_0011752 [Adiantum capillus-veneris]
MWAIWRQRNCYMYEEAYQVSNLRIFFDEIVLQIEKLSIAECRIYRKKHKMLDTSGDFFQRAGVDEELCYMRDIMEEEIQEDVNSQLEKWQHAITLLVKIRCELDALKI